MRVVLHTHSATHAESARIALTAEGIEVVMLDEFSPGALGLQGSLRVAVTNDADVERATRVIKSLEPPKAPPLPSWRWHKRALIAFVAGFLMMFGIMELNTIDVPRALRVAALLANLALLVSAAAFYLIGARADERQVSRKPGD